MYIVRRHEHLIPLCMQCSQPLLLELCVCVRACVCVEQNIGVKSTLSKFSKRMRTSGVLQANTYHLPLLSLLTWEGAKNKDRKKERSQSDCFEVLISSCLLPLLLHDFFLLVAFSLFPLSFCHFFFCCALKALLMGWPLV